MKARDERWPAAGGPGTGPASRAILVTAAALVIAGAGCTPRTALDPIGAVEVAEGRPVEALAEAGLDRAAVARAANAALSSAGFPASTESGKGARIAVEAISVGIVRTDAAGGPAAEVVVELRLDPDAGGNERAREAGRGIVPLRGGNGRTAWAEALGRALSEASRGLALTVEAIRKPDAGLVRDLEDPDGGVRLRAVRALAARGARGAAAAVARHVRDPDRDVRGAVMDALAAFRDPATATALIDAAQAGDAGATLRFIPILVELGGPDVEGYLLTLEAGHPDRAVRAAAADGLARVRPGRTAPAVKR